MGIRVTVPGSAVACRTWHLWWYRRGTDADIPLEVVSDEARDEAVMYCDTADRISVDAGGGFVPIGPDPDTQGIALGTFLAGERKAVIVRYRLDAAALRLDQPRLLIDLGTAAVPPYTAAAATHGGGGVPHGEEGGYHGGGA